MATIGAMEQVPQRYSLVAQAKEILRQKIQAGEWTHYLPSEVRLCDKLQISRVTLRTALAQLVAEKIISTGRGKRRTILQRATKKKPAASHFRQVVLLTPIALEALPRFELYWIDDLREHLAEAGFHLEIYPDTRCYGQGWRKALKSLSQQFNPAGWILLKSTPQIQKWFSQKMVPAVIAGSRHAGVKLPFVDIDHRALCRHAAGQFLARGHRRLVFVSLAGGLAGDMESERGFMEAIELTRGRAEGLVLRHSLTPEDICARLRRLVGDVNPPTAFLVSKAYHSLTVMGFLRNRGLRVPDDFSLISRDHESYLAHTVPPIACYAAKPERLAREITRLLLEMISSGILKSKDCRIMPDFIAGGTLAAFPFNGGK